MTPVHRVLVGLVALTAAFAPVTTAASPSPSPTLSDVLAPAPSPDYVEADATSQSLMEGAFNAQGYASKTSGGHDVQVTLERNGFIGGFGRTWVQRGTQHVLIEAVLAFDGARDAKKWLTAVQLKDKSDLRYLHPLSYPGLGDYYGAHLVGDGVVTDTFGMVKGNDYFWVIAISRQDDLGSTAATQAKAVHDFAPPYTIPPNQWPESIATPRERVSGFGPLIGDLLLVAFLISLAILIFAMVRRSMRRSPTPPVDAPAAVQLSPDGNYWWDGKRWRDTSREAPSWARMSSDRKLWWDGRHWRPVPKARV
jgi:hypothetical protein